MPLLHTADGAHDLAWRAVTALKRILVEECLLNRVQGVIVARQALNSHDGLAHGCQQREAGQHLAAAELHGAGTALAVVAALLGTGQLQVLAQGIEQRRPRIQFHLVSDTVDANLHAAVLRCPEALHPLNNQAAGSFRRLSAADQSGSDAT